MVRPMGEVSSLAIGKFTIPTGSRAHEHSTHVGNGQYSLEDSRDITGVTGNIAQQLGFYGSLVFLPKLKRRYSPLVVSVDGDERQLLILYFQGIVY